MSVIEESDRSPRRPKVTMTIDREVIERVKTFAERVRTPYDDGVPFSRVVEAAIVEYLDRHEPEAILGQGGESDPTGR